MTQDYDTVFILMNVGPDGFANFSVYEDYQAAEEAKRRRDAKPIFHPDRIRREIVQAPFRTKEES
ncbi:hypothetical protein BPY_07110 [Bifidobacterium psychraerophilum]|uniref:hypothetical protein n=1 Tax=Bifidobacterium psychraerophilum TaxID=218140 RepID=UPI0031122248